MSGPSHSVCHNQSFFSLFMWGFTRQCPILVPSLFILVPSLFQYHPFFSPVSDPAYRVSFHNVFPHHSRSTPCTRPCLYGVSQHNVPSSNQYCSIPCFTPSTDSTIHSWSPFPLSECECYIRVIECGMYQFQFLQSTISSGASLTHYKPYSGSA